MDFTNNITSTRYKTKPILVLLKRGSIVESIHKVHAVASDSKGRILMFAGTANYETFIRSSLKPFQILPFISSGTAEKIHSGEKGIAISCSSHIGTNSHAREVFKLLWNSFVDVNNLQCPIPEGYVSQLQHNCSGKHASFLATSKMLGWSLENYLDAKHPIQIEINRRVAELLGLPTEELVAARDDCGAPTLFLQLVQMAQLYGHLCGSKQPEFEKICRAMIGYPELVAGKGRFDTELMKRAHGQIISKGGAEGIQCIGRIGEGIGLAIKVEDGSRRAKQAVALHLLQQLDWITPTALQELEDQMLLISPGVQLEVIGNLGFVETQADH